MRSVQAQDFQILRFASARGKEQGACHKYEFPFQPCPEQVPGFAGLKSILVNLYTIAQKKGPEQDQDEVNGKKIIIKSNG